MSNPTTIGAAGLAMTKTFEGYPNHGLPYWDRPASDPRRVATIGYGTTRINGRPVTMNTPRLSEQEASRLLVGQINGPSYAGELTRVLNALGLNLNQNEYDALLSACYNLGAGILDKGRSLGDALRSGANWRHEVAKALPLYSEPGNPNVHAGLLRRRNAEVALFKTPVVHVASKPADRLAGYRDDEVRWIREYDKLPRRRVVRRRVLRRVMARRAHEIAWAASKIGVTTPKGMPKPDGHGWDYHRRKDRYNSLVTRGGH